MLKVMLSKARLFVKVPVKTPLNRPTPEEFGDSVSTLKKVLFPTESSTTLKLDAPMIPPAYPPPAPE